MAEEKGVYFHTLRLLLFLSSRPAFFKEAFSAEALPAAARACARKIRAARVWHGTKINAMSRYGSPCHSYAPFSFYAVDNILPTADEQDNMITATSAAMDTATLRHYHFPRPRCSRYSSSCFDFTLLSRVHAMPAFQPFRPAAAFTIFAATRLRRFAADITRRSRCFLRWL